MVIFKAKQHRRVNPGHLFRQVLIGLGLFLFAAGAYLVNDRFLKVTSVDCRQENGSCPETVTALVGRYRGRSLLLLRLRQIETEVLATGLAESVSLKTALPGRFEIRLTPPRNPFLVKSVFSEIVPELSFIQATAAGQIVPPSVELGIFAASASGRSFRLLATGVLDQSDQTSNYFLIARAIPSREYLLTAYSWLIALQSAHLLPEAVYFLPDIIVIKVKDQPDYLVSLSADPSQTLLALQRISSAITINELRVIDFRYNHPILK